jgi:hypothetical protein
MGHANATPSLALRTRRPSPAGRQRGNEGTTLMLNAIATKENAG